MAAAPERPRGERPADAEPVAGEDPAVPELVRRMRVRQEAHRQRGVVYRAAFVLGGVVVLAAGIAMLALPGPGWAAIIVGLAILALEFAWAERLLERVIVQAEKARRTAEDATPAQKRLTAAAVVVACGAALAAAILWDIPLLPV